MGALVLKPCSQCLIETTVSIKHRKFQMFYHKAAVWGRWCLSLVLNA